MFWERAGSQNTDATIHQALKRMEELNINDLVVASCQGNTISKVLDLAPPGTNLVCVTHHQGFQTSGENEMDAKTRQELASRGVKLLTTTHFFAGADRALRNQFGGVYPAEIMAQTLRIFGQGAKVAIEISIMALDAGLIPYGQEIVALGGTISGADTAIVVAPAHSNHFFQTQVREVICMPREKKTE